MLVIFFILFILNCLTEYQLNRMMIAIKVLEKKNRIYHGICAALRIIWISVCTWLTVPVPVLLIGLFILIFLNTLPYGGRRSMMINFTMIIYLFYISLLMLVIGCAGLLNMGVDHIIQDTFVRMIVLNVTFIIFNVLCYFLMRNHPEFLWKEEYDRSKAVIYTRFLSVCVIYHILDAVILTLYETSRLNYLLLVSGDILILILMFNFLNYNYVFAKSEKMKKEYEENEILIAQQYFEKETLKKMSEMDSLTNTYNRREITSIMMEHIQSDHKLVCVFLDLDGLKRVNDKYGHTYGDLMLKRFADACTDMMQGYGYLARIGGDEFLLVFIDRDTSYVEDCIKKLQIQLLDTMEEKEKIFFSYGIAYDEESVDKYITSADQRMYACKNRKRCDDK